MSIASNVIDTNTKLATVRANLKALLEEHGILYYDDDDVFTLARRAWFLIYPSNKPLGGSYSSETTVGNQIDFSVYMQDDNGNNLPDDSVADFFISVNGGSEIHLTGKSENGYASCPYVAQNSGDSLYIRSMINDWMAMDAEIEVYAFRYQDDWDMDLNNYTLVKYPSSANITTSIVDEFNSQYSYANGIEVSKTYGSSQAAYMIPTSLIDGIDMSDNGIHFSAIVSPMYSSSSGWASGICLLNSKTLTHYRDTSILELGAFPGKKGLKYSGSNHTITEINTTSGQLTLNNAFKFDLWYDGAYVKAMIQDYREITTYYSYESSSLPSAIASMQTVFPAFMIYDYGGKIRFRDAIIEPWSNE